MTAACQLAPACSVLPEPYRAKPIWTSAPRLRVLTAPELARRVAREFDIAVADMAARERAKSIAAARHVFWWLARRLWGASYPELGRLLRGPVKFDHTTTMSGVRKVERALDAEAAFRAGMRPTGSLVGEKTLALLMEIEMAQVSATGATSGPISSSESNEGSDHP